MKRALFFILLLIICVPVIFAQVSKTVNLTAAGTLSTALTATELSTITNLTITGTIDAQDFKTMRDLMPVLADINLSGVTVAEYTGTEGTAGSELLTYSANTIPGNAFNHPTTWTPKLTLTKFTTSNSITKIDYGVFQSCNNLAEVSLPAVKNISARVFTDCIGLKSIYIPVIDSIGWGSFQGCTSLTSIQLPQALSFIGNFAFCYSSISFSVDDNNPYYSSLDGVLFNKDKTSLIQCPITKVGVYNIPSSVQTLEYVAFGNCNKLTEITIPQSVSNFYNNVFDNCYGLRTIKVEWLEPLNFNYAIDVFIGVDKNLCTLNVPSGSKTAYEAADQWKDFQNIVEMASPYKMPLEVTAGGLAALLPQSVRDTLTYLSLTGTIDARDFRIMRDSLPVLANLDISSASIVGFNGNDGTSIRGTNNYEANTIPEFAFCNKDWVGKNSLVSIVFPTTITTIQYCAFVRCNGLKLLNIPEGVTTIVDAAFSECAGLTNINIPSSVSTIRNDAFRNSPGQIFVNEMNSQYSSLDGILFNEDKTYIIHCPIDKTGEYIIPKTVTNIGWIAFEGCSDITSITIPSSVKEIGVYAFMMPYGSNLSEIISFSKTPVVFHENALVFEGINKTTCTLYVPFAYKSAYQTTDRWQDFQNIVEMNPVYEMPLEVTAGGLAALLPQSIRDTLTYLALTGTIDARDFRIMRDSLPVLTDLDLSEVDIVEYNGTGGTSMEGGTNYPANAIPEYAFMYKKSLISINLPISATMISTFAFGNNWGLTSISISPNIIVIKRDAFAACHNISQIYIPASVQTIENAFDGNQGLFYVEDGNLNYSSLDGVLFDKSQKTLISCPRSITGAYTIPNTVEIIDYIAFGGCYQLTSIHIPSSVKIIRDAAFDQCYGIVEFELPSSIEFIGNRAFFYCFGMTSFEVKWQNPLNLTDRSDVFLLANVSNCTLKVPFGTSSLYATAEFWKDFQNIVEMEPVYEMPLEVKAGGLAALLPQSVRDTLTYLALTGTIDARDFKTMRDLMPALAEIDLSGVIIAEYIGTEGTAGTDNFEYPINTIPSKAFIHPTSWLAKLSLVKIITSNSVTKIDYGAFQNCYNLAQVLIPAVKKIGARAFTECAGLKTIDIPVVDSIEWGAFQDCIGLTSIQLPASLSYIGNFAFAYSSINFFVNESNPYYSSHDGILFNMDKTLLIQCPVTKTGEYVIPNTVQTLAYVSFGKCTKLTDITIPESVSSFYNSVFFDCSGLKSIKSLRPEPVNFIYTYDVFTGVDKEQCILHVPFGSKAAYQSANQWKDFQNIVEMPGIALSDNAIDMYANATSKTINITSNIEWTALSNQPWLTLSPNSANGSQTLQLMATANYSGLTRSAIVTISAIGVESQTIVVTQLGIVIQGNSTVYGLASTAPNRRAIPVTFNENGEINSISVYHNGGSGNMLLGVYTDVAGKPASRLGVTSSVAVNAAEGWQTVAFASPVSVSSGQKVWLSFVFQNSVAVRYEAGTPGRAISSQTWSAGMPDEFGASGVSNYNFSVYCNYTPVEISEKPLGNTVVYNTTSTAANRRAIPVTFNENGEINSISVYHNGGSGNMLLGVYTDVAGKPASRLGVTSSVAVNAAEGWQTVALANPVSVSSGQKVWLSFVFQNSVAVRYEAGTPGRAMSSQTWSAGMPDEFGVSGVSNYNFSVYCNYTPVEISEKPLGNTVVYSTTSTAANRRAIPVTFNENGEINSISVYHNGGSGNMLLGVYTDVAGKPASRLGVTSSVAVNAAEGWQTVALANPVSVSSGQKVWLSFVFQNSVAVRYEAGTPGRAMSSQTWPAGMPDNFGTSGVSNYNFSVYCSYTPVEISEKPLGNTVVYSTTSTAANRRAISVTFNENGEINSISVYHNGGSGNMLLGVYTDVSGKPASRLGVTSSVAVNAAEGWQTVALANPVSVSSGQKVWLSFVFQNSVAVRYEAGTPGRAMSSQTWSAGMPDEFGTSGISNYNFSVYCNYTPASSVLSKSGQYDNMVTETIENPIGEANELKVYPNPFSQKLNFEFVSARNANAILEIYNLNGQLIAKLLDQQVQGGVMNRIEYTPNEIISGMYIYKLNLDGNISVGKVIYRK